MNILGVDYGKKRTGLAWMQVGLDVVLPFGVVGGLEELVSVIKKENIDKIVFGMPFGLDAKENKNTDRVNEFVGELKTKIDKPIFFVDERFTSAQADRMEGEASRDEKAAMLILRGYLDNKK